MKIKLIFQNWTIDGIKKLVLDFDRVVEVSPSDLHPGSVCYGSIELDGDEEDTLLDAAEDGIRPVFMIIPR